VWLKLTIDLWENFYKKINFDFSFKLKKEETEKTGGSNQFGYNYKCFVDFAYNIYNCFSDEEIKFIYHEIAEKSLGLKKLIETDQVNCFKTKSEYLSFYGKLKNEFTALAQGLSREQFLL